MGKNLLVLTCFISALVVGASVGLFFHVPVSFSSITQSVGCGTNCVSSSTPATSVSDELITPTIPETIFDQSFVARTQMIVKPKTNILLLPHHLIAAHGIASLISSTPKPDLVYLLAPDHFTQGKSTFTTTDASFQTQAGIVESDPEEIANLLHDVPSLRNDRIPFVREHGVTAILPFLAKAWPGVNVVPIIVRVDATAEDRAALAAALVDALRANENALLVSSIDFSHYQTAAVADFHDELALDVVSSLADKEADRVEVDSPGALAVTLRVARALGLGDVTIQQHTNSLRLTESTLAQESTSHILASFAPGEIQPQKKTTLLFLGDMMFDRNVLNRIKSAGSFEYPFAKIHGQENRFFWGQDAIIANLEGPVTTMRRAPQKEIDFLFDQQIVSVLKKMNIDAVSQANNHSLDQGRIGAEESKTFLRNGGLAVFGDEVRDDTASAMTILERRGKKIALLGFNITDNPLDRTAAAAAITTAKQQTDRVVIFIHWGLEYHDRPEPSQVALAHWFIDQGVDAVIGGHPHWVQSVEVYKNHPIAYSLGNFIFDQDWSEKTKLGLAVGLELSDQGDALHLFPIQITKSQPQLLTADARKTQLAHLAAISDPALSSEILSGVIRIAR